MWASEQTAHHFILGMAVRALQTMQTPRMALTLRSRLARVALFVDDFSAQSGQHFRPGRAGAFPQVTQVPAAERRSYLARM